MGNRNNKELARKTAEALKCEILSTEYRILVSLHECRQMNVGEIAADARAAPATIQNKLKNLWHLGLVAYDVDHRDLRRRVYMLTPQCQETIDREMMFLATWFPSHTSGPESADLKGFIQRLEQALRIRVFSIAYLIVLGIYEMGQISTADLERWCDVPSRSFFNALNRLVNLGIVVQSADHVDHRRKVNALSAPVAELLDETHTELRRWVNGIPYKASE